MSKRTIGILYILTVIMGVVGSTFTTTGNGYSTTGHFGNLTLFIIGVILASLAGIPYLIAWIGALVNLARLQQWVWFVLVFIFHGIALLIYLIAGPTTPAGVPQYSQYAPRSDLPPQPPQNYPRS